MTEARVATWPRGRRIKWVTLAVVTAAVILVVHGLWLPWIGRFLVVRDPLQVADALAPGALLGLAIAALGGYLAGRILGAPSEVPWAVEAFGVRRHPVALYMALATLTWLAVVLWADQRPRPPGWVALLAIFGYAATVLFTTPLAADSLTIGDGWRVPQILALVAVGASGWLLGRMAGQESRVAATAGAWPGQEDV